jgi:hypothetical protein
MNVDCMTTRRSLAAITVAALVTVMTTRSSPTANSVTSAAVVRAWEQQQACVLLGCERGGLARL